MRVIARHRVRTRSCLTRRGSRLAAAGALAALAASHPAAAVTRDEAVRAVLTDPDHADAPGCVAGEFANGRTVRITAQGEADIAARRPLGPETLFYGASLSKQFTALAAATLVVQGKLALEDDIRRYLPELPQYRRPVTVGMLMHHTSGIRDSLGLLRMAGMNDVGKAGKDEALSLLLRQRDTAFEPGSAYDYSNGGYLLLAEIVERVSGEAFADYARKAIFRPARMPRAYFLGEGAPVAGSFAHGYVPEGAAFAVRDTFPRFSGSGGLMLSMEDIAAWEADVARRRRVWTPEIARIMLAPGLLNDGTPANDGKGLGYAGGLHVGLRGGERVIEHGGSAEAFKHAFLRLPDSSRSFALLCNRGDWKAADKLAEVMRAAGVAPPAKVAAQPVGRFRSDELDADYVLAAEGDGLSVTIVSPLADGAGPVHFSPGSDGRFHAGPMAIAVSADPDRITASRGGSGDLVLVRTAEGDRP